MWERNRSQVLWNPFNIIIIIVDEVKWILAIGCSSKICNEVYS